MAAAAAPPETALPAADDPEYEEECRICRLPAQAGRPLRRPCACRGSIRFVHDHCQLRWLATRQQSQSQTQSKFLWKNSPLCDVCKHDISTCPLYATGTPARLPISEFMLGLPNKLMGFLIPLYITFWTIWEFAIPLTTLWTWRLAFARTYAQVHHFLSVRLSSTSILADVVLCLAMPFLEAPSARRVPGLGRRAQGQRFRFFGVQAHTLLLAAGSPLMVVMVDMYLACIFGLLPFSLGRIILWSRLCHSFRNLDVVDSYTSTASILLIGYGFISMVGATFVVLHTSYKYLRGERLVIAIFLGRLPGILFGGIVSSITVANIFLNLLIKVIIYPLLFGWSLDICTAKMFGATMSQRLNLLTASSFASTAFHCLIGRTFLNLHPQLSRTIEKILRPGVNIPFLHHDVREPFYKFCSKKLLCLFVDTIFVSLVILVPINIADRLAPELFSLDITFLSVTITFYLEWLVGTVIRYWFVTAGQALRNNIAPKDQYGNSSEASDNRKSVAIRTMMRMVLAWLTAVIFNTAMLFFSISVGCAMLLFNIPHLPVAAGGLKSNDLFATAVGFCIIPAIIAAARDLFACMTSRGTWLLALKMLLLVLTWMVIIPLLIGLLVDLLLISPFIGPDDDFPVLDFFCIWSLGSLLKKLWIKLAHCTASEPFLAYFIDERWEGRLKQAKVYPVFQVYTTVLVLPRYIMPMAMKLLAALGAPYVLAKGVFPRFGYSDAMNSTVYRFAWLGILCFCVLCYLGKVFCVQLHDYIKDDRYIIGQRLEDVGDGS